MSEDRTVEFTLNGHSYVFKYYDGNHSYRVSEDGGPLIPYVGTSGISKIERSDPGGLMNYARKETLAGRDHNETTKATQECGKAAHKQLDALAQTGEPPDLSGQPERVRGALQAVAKWWLDKSPVFKASEMMVCSPTHKFAGRFDFLAEVDGELFLGDLKTTEKDWDHFKEYKAAAAYAQLAGYAIAYSEMFPDAIQPTKRAILHVNTSGDFDWKPDLAPEESEAAFLSKLETYRADQAWTKAYKVAA